MISMMPFSKTELSLTWHFFLQMEAGKREGAVISFLQEEININFLKEEFVKK